jgi:hypothetical protein
VPDDLPDDLPIDPDEPRPEEGRILSPDELDITKSEYVEEIDEGRFVVSPHEERVPQTDSSERSQTSDADAQPEPEDAHATPQGESQPEPGSQQPQAGGQSRAGGQPPAGGQPQPTAPQPAPTGAQQGALTQEAVHNWLRQDFEQNGSRYAFDVTATFDGSVSQRRMASNDVVTIFESLMLWYAQQVDSNTPVEEILGILLMESNVPVRYPAESVQQLVKSSNLGPNDSIADLLSAVQDDGVQL